MKSSFRIYIVLSTLLVLGASDPYNYYQQPPGYYHQEWRQQPDAPIQYLPPDHEWQIRNYHQPSAQAQAQAQAQTHHRSEFVNYRPVNYPAYSEAYSSPNLNMHHQQKENHIIKKVIVPITGSPQILNLSPDGDSQQVKITQVRPENDGTYDDRGLPEVVKQALAKFLANENNYKNHTHAFTIIAHDDAILQQPDNNMNPANPGHQHPIFNHHRRGPKPFKPRITPPKKMVKTTVIATNANDMAAAEDNDVETIEMSESLAELTNAEAIVIPAGYHGNADVIPRAHQQKHTVLPIPAPAYIPMPASAYNPMPIHAPRMPGHVLPQKPTSNNFYSYSSGDNLPNKESKHMPVPAHKPIPVHDYKHNHAFIQTPTAVLAHKPAPSNHIENSALIIPQSGMHLPETYDYYSSDETSPAEQLKHIKASAQKPPPVYDHINIPNQAKPNDFKSSDTTSTAEKEKHMLEPTQKPTSVPSSTDYPVHTKPTHSSVGGHKKTQNKYDSSYALVTAKSENNSPKANNSKTSPTEKENPTKKPAQKSTPVPGYNNSPTYTKPAQSLGVAFKPTPDEQIVTDVPGTPKSENDLPKTDNDNKISSINKDKPTQVPTQKPTPVPGSTNTPTQTKSTQSSVGGHKTTPKEYDSNDSPKNSKSNDPKKHSSKSDESDSCEETPLTEQVNHKEKPAEKPTQVASYNNSASKPTPRTQIVNDGPASTKSDKHLPEYNDSDSCEEIVTSTEKKKTINEPTQKPTPVPRSTNSPTNSEPTQSSEGRHRSIPNKHDSNDAPVTPKSENNLPKADDSKSSPTKKENPTKIPAQKPTTVFTNSPTHTKLNQNSAGEHKPTSIKHDSNDTSVAPKSEKLLPKSDDSKSSHETPTAEKGKHMKERTQKPTSIPGSTDSPTHPKPIQSSVGELKLTTNKHDSHDTSTTPGDSDCSDETSTEKVNPTTKPSQKPTPVLGSPNNSKPTKSSEGGHKPTPNKDDSDDSDYLINDVPVIPKSEKHLSELYDSKSSNKTPTTENEKPTEEPTQQPTLSYNNSSTYSKPTRSPGVAIKPTPGKGNQVVNNAPSPPKSRNNSPKTDNSDEMPSTDKEKQTQVSDSTISSTHTEPTQSFVEGHTPTSNKHDSLVSAKSVKHVPESDESDSCEETTPEQVKFTEEPAQKLTLAPDYDYIPANAKPTYNPVAGNKPTPGKHGKNDAPATPKSEKYLPEFDDSNSCENTLLTENKKQTKEPSQKPTPVPHYNISPSYTKPTQTPRVANKPTPDKHVVNDAPVTLKSEKYSSETEDSYFSEKTSPLEKVKNSTESTQKVTAVPGYDNIQTQAIPVQSSKAGHKPTPYNQNSNDSPVTPVSENDLPETDKTDSFKGTTSGKNEIQTKRPAQKTTPVPSYNNKPKSNDFESDTFDDLFPIFQIEASDHVGKKYIVKCANPFIPIDECDDQLLIVTEEESSDQSKKDSAKDTERHHCYGSQDKTEAGEKKSSSKNYAEESDTLRNEKFNDDKEAKYDTAETDDENQENTKKHFEESDTKKTYIDNEVKKHVIDTKEVSSVTSHREKTDSVIKHETETEVKHKNIEDENSQQSKSKDTSLETQDPEETEENAALDSKTEPVNPISYIVSLIRRALNRNYAVNQFFKDPGVKKVVQRTFQ